MGERAAIVVAHARTQAGYRTGAHGDALVLEQHGLAPARPTAAIVGAALGVAAGLASIVALLPPLAAAGSALAAAALGAGLGHTLARSRRTRGGIAVRLVVAERALRVFRPGDAPQPQARLPIAELAAIRLEALPTAPGAWTLVAVRQDGTRVGLLETEHRHAGLRVLTLVLDRLVRDGAFEGVPMASTRCPACDARLLAPARWLPISVACGECGTEGTLARA